jgi:hypothetical protein
VAQRSPCDSNSYLKLLVGKSMIQIPSNLIGLPFLTADFISKAS